MPMPITPQSEYYGLGYRVAAGTEDIPEELEELAGEQGPKITPGLLKGVEHSFGDGPQSGGSYTGEWPGRLPGDRIVDSLDAVKDRVKSVLPTKA